MNTFVVPDIHGKHKGLFDLLLAAGVIDSKGKRIYEGPVVSIGDLLNAVFEDIGRDEETLADALSWIDKFILGNHEAPYLFNHIPFAGFYYHGPLAQDYKRLHREGKVVPALLVGETLLTHAGLAKVYKFKTARDAYDGIMDVWHNYDRYAERQVMGWQYHEKFTFGSNSVWKGTILDGIGYMRGGRFPTGGILWSDYSEKKNPYFNQVFGHTPRSEGPKVVQNEKYGTWYVDIDRGQKSGTPAAGLWLDEDGQIVEIVYA